MNGRKAKMLRRAAEYRPEPARYEKPELHHLGLSPVYDKHVRTVRSWDPKAGKIVGTEATKVRMRPDGKTPLAIMMRKATAEELAEQYPEMVPATDLVPVAKPRRLLAGTAKRVYRLLKTLDRRIGLSGVEQQFGLTAIVDEM